MPLCSGARENRRTDGLLLEPGAGGGGGRWLPGTAAPRPSGTFSLPSRWPPAGLTPRAPCGALSTRRRGGAGGDEAPTLKGRGFTLPMALALPGPRTVPATGQTSRNICAVRVAFSSFRPRSQGVILIPRAGHVRLPLFDKVAEDVSVWRQKDARNPVCTHYTLSPGTQSGPPRPRVSHPQIQLTVAAWSESADAKSAAAGGIPGEGFTQPRGLGATGAPGATPPRNQGTAVLMFPSDFKKS